MAPQLIFNQTTGLTLRSANTMAPRLIMNHTRDSAFSIRNITTMIPWSNLMYNNTINAIHIQGMGTLPHGEPDFKHAAPISHTQTPQFITTTIRSFAYLSIVVAIMLAVAYTLTSLREEDDELGIDEETRSGTGHDAKFIAGKKGASRKRGNRFDVAEGLAKTVSNEEAWKLVVKTLEECERELVAGEIRVDEETPLLGGRDGHEQWRQIEMRGEARTLMKKDCYVTMNYVMG